MIAARYTETALDAAFDTCGMPRVTPVVKPGGGTVVPLKPGQRSGLPSPHPLSGPIPPHIVAMKGRDMNAAMRAGFKATRFDELPDADKAAMVAAMLAHPPIVALANTSYEVWRDISWAAAHAAYLGAPGVRDMALAWSKTSPKFKPETEAAFDVLWNSYKPNYPGGKTIGTLIGKARDTGFPVSNWFDDDEATPNLLMPTIAVGGADPFDALAGWTDPDLVPFVYGTMLARGYITLLGAGGGTGKSALATGFAVCGATGRTLLGDHVDGRLRVLLLNLEDGRSKIRRGVKAACQHHKVNPGDLQGYLFIAGVDDISPVVPGGLRLVTIDPNTRRETINEAVFTWLKGEITSRKIDVLMIDPFSRLIRGNENAVDVVDQLMERLTVLAGGTGIAILIAQHLRKNGGGLQQDGAASFRGSGAIVDAARNAFSARRITADEAAKIGVFGPENVIVVSHEKGNLSRLQEPTFYRIVPVRLPGGNPQTDPPHVEAGRWAHAVERFTPMSAAQAITDPMRNAVMVALDRGMKDAAGLPAPYGPPPSKPGGKVSNNPIPACAAALQSAVPGLDTARAEALAISVISNLIEKAYVTQQPVEVQKYAKRDDGSFKSNGKNNRQGLIVHWQAAPWRVTPGVIAAVSVQPNSTTPEVSGAANV